MLAVRDGIAPPVVLVCAAIGRTLRFAAVAVAAAGLGRLVDRVLPRIAVPLVATGGPAFPAAFWAIAVRG